MALSETQMRRARFIRTVLAYHDLTQSDLGRLLGCSQVNAGRKLRGMRRFSDDELLVIAEAFGIDPAAMLRPPDLEHVFGAVRTPDGGLLTCTKDQLPWSRAMSWLTVPKIHLAANAA